MSNTQYQTFTLGDYLTEEQIKFFDKNGFIHFRGAVTLDEVKAIIASTEDLQKKWITKGIKKINGVPIKYGHDENGNEIVHRFPFTSQYCEPVPSRFPRSRASTCAPATAPSN